MPFFSRWSPTGRDWSHGASDLELLIPEFDRALSGEDPGSERARMLGKLLAMARCALAENLVMVVDPDQRLTRRPPPASGGDGAVPGPAP